MIVYLHFKNYLTFISKALLSNHDKNTGFKLSNLSFFTKALCFVFFKVIFFFCIVPLWTFYKLDIDPNKKTVALDFNNQQ